MKKLFLGLTIVTGLAISPLAQAKEKEVVVATAGDIRPFSFEKKGQLTGYDIEVLKAADKLMDDYRFAYKKTSWESIFVGLDSGHYQVAANNLSYTKERADKYLYSKPIATNPLVLVSPNNAKVNQLNDIGGLKTQDDTGTSTAKLVSDWNKKHKDNPSTIDYSGEDVSKRLLDLENGEFDYLIFDKISVETIIKQKSLDLYVTDIKSNDNPNNYIMFAEDQDALQKSFNGALEKLQDSGKLKELSKIHLGGNYLAPSKTNR
ncbi:transporter substrate-binding domain-containing protein [Streptococcus halotolerans]|uniref:transporter substrate-binding domain-containing protein n=1 Tax=Streptococcus halotolerans TaxID=1814128 RepID=UPI000787E8DD|nr:transporter substrate-binding domain-containing protein [Streptococcus halotolerans]